MLTKTKRAALEEELDSNLNVGLIGFKINKKHISVLDVYYPSLNRRKLLGSSVQMLTGPIGKVTPFVFKGFELVERNEFYGMDNGFLPERFLPDYFLTIFNNFYGVQKTGPGEIDITKYPNQKVEEFKLEVDSKIALELTRDLREYIPNELLKGFKTYD